MKYFIIEKICKNACKLTFIGESFDNAAEFAERRNGKSTYILTGSQVRDILFSGCSSEYFNEYMKGHFKHRIGDTELYMYMPLPANFEESLSDLNTLFLTSMKAMD